MPFKCGTLRCAIELGRHPGCLSLAQSGLTEPSAIRPLLEAKRTSASDWQTSRFYEYTP